jgi:dihydrofolate synthase / folylpolyglutamate synthase
VLRREPTLVLDGAHNPDKMAALSDALRAVFHWRHLIAVLAFKRGHDAKASLSSLAPMLDRAVLTRFQANTDFGKDTAQSTSEIAGALASLGAECDIQAEEPAEAALASAMAGAADDDLVLVTGSLYLVGQLRAALLGE